MTWQRKNVHGFCLDYSHRATISPHIMKTARVASANRPAPGNGGNPIKGMRAAITGKNEEIISHDRSCFSAPRSEAAGGDNG
jgi:hypothetical protein